MAGIIRPAATSWASYRKTCANSTSTGSATCAETVVMARVTTWHIRHAGATIACRKVSMAVSGMGTAGSRDPAQVLVGPIVMGTA